jgi:hypothetical protein
MYTRTKDILKEIEREIESKEIEKE